MGTKISVHAGGDKNTKRNIISIRDNTYFKFAHLLLVKHVLPDGGLRRAWTKAPKKRERERERTRERENANKGRKLQ